MGGAEFAVIGLGLVARIATGYRGYGLPISEVILEGNVGLIQAVKRFERACARLFPAVSDNFWPTTGKAGSEFLITAAGPPVSPRNVAIAEAD